MDKLTETMRRFLKPLACLLAALLSVPALAQDEDTIKIGYLYNFAKFVEWPAAVESQPGQPWTFCVLGDEVVKSVAAMLEGKQVRRVIVASGKLVNIVVS